MTCFYYCVQYIWKGIIKGMNLHFVNLRFVNMPFVNLNIPCSHEWLQSMGTTQIVHKENECLRNEMLPQDTAKLVLQIRRESKTEIFWPYEEVQLEIYDTQGWGGQWQGKETEASRDKDGRMSQISSEQ